MDLTTFKSFLEGQEMAFDAVLQTIDNLNPADLKRYLDQHFARMQRKLRNAVEVTTTTPTLAASFNPLKALSTPSGKLATRKNSSFISERKPGQKPGGSSLSFRTRNKVYIDTDSSIGSPPESPVRKRSGHAESIDLEDLSPSIRPQPARRTTVPTRRRLTARRGGGHSGILGKSKADRTGTRTSSDEADGEGFVDEDLYTAEDDEQSAKKQTRH